MIKAVFGAVMSVNGVRGHCFALDHVIDEDGNEVPEVVFNWSEEFQAFFDARPSFQIRIFEVTEGSEYIVRAENLTGDLLPVRVSPLQLEREAAERMIAGGLEQ